MELGLTLPPLRQPAGSYRGWRHAGDLLFLSGQGADGHVGRVGDDLTLEQGQAAARACALNLLAQTRDALGSLDRVAEIVKVLGFVCCTPDFTQQPLVINGASDLLRSVFGEDDRRARPLGDRGVCAAARLRRRDRDGRAGERSWTQLNGFTTMTPP